MSKNNLIGVLARILIDHGMTVKYDDSFYRDENVDADDLQKSIKKIESEVKNKKQQIFQRQMILMKKIPKIR